MPSELAWHDAAREPVVALLGYATLYALQFFVGQTAGFERVATRLPWPPAVAVGFGRKLLGFVLLGMGSVILMLAVMPEPLGAYGLRALPTLADLAWMGAAGPPIVLLAALGGRLGSADPARSELGAAHAAFWVIYLVGYELALRGFVLLPCVRAFGTWPAIAVNLALYMLVHLPKDARETAASVPFGLVACIAVVQTGSVWAPIVLHAAAAVTHDAVAGRRVAR